MAYFGEAAKSSSTSKLFLDFHSEYMRGHLLKYMCASAPHTHTCVNLHGQGPDLCSYGFPSCEQEEDGLKPTGLGAAAEQRGVLGCGLFWLCPLRTQAFGLEPGEKFPWCHVSLPKSLGPHISPSFLFIYESLF